MGCVNSQIDKPPVVVRVKERPKQDNQILRTEMAEVDGKSSAKQPEIPKFIGRQTPSNRVMPAYQKVKDEQEITQERKVKEREVRRRQEEQIKQNVLQEQLQFKLQKDSETKFRAEQERIKAEEMKKRAAEKERIGPNKLSGASDPERLKAIDSGRETLNASRDSGVDSSLAEDNDRVEALQRHSRFNLSGIRKTGWDNEELVVTERRADPDPRPPTYRKKDIVPDVIEFKMFDKHAIQAPPSARDSVSTLVNYLKGSAENQFQLVRMFYRWITFNISFDVEAFFDETGTSPTEAGDVLKTCKTTSEGYSKLMEAMCRYVNIPAKVLNGLVKGYDYQIGDVINFTETYLAHYWNAVYINANWFFIDCTWGAGLVDRKRKWNRQFQEFYFIVDPDKMIVDHFPFMDGDLRTSSKWQLLSSPISANSFNQRLKMERAALEWEVKPMSHTQNHIIMVRHEVEIQLQEVADPLEEYTVQFKRKDGSRNLESYMFPCKIQERTLKVLVRPPEEIDYVLNIYGKKSLDQTGKPDLLVSYILKCVEANYNIRKFPVNFRIYGAVSDYRKYGFSSDLTNCVQYTSNSGELILPFKAKSDVRCMTKLEHITEKMDLTSYCFTTGKVHGISIKMRLPFKGYYKFTIFGKVSDNGNHRPVATFLIDCLQTAHVHSGFPVAFDAAIRLKCSLYKPLWKDLPANSKINVVLGCPNLQNVKVLFTPLSRDENYIFEGTVQTPSPGQPFTIYGQETENGPMIGLYHYTIF